jgi:hypothetical protein
MYRCRRIRRRRRGTLRGAAHSRRRSLSACGSRLGQWGTGPRLSAVSFGTSGAAARRRSSTSRRSLRSCKPSGAARNRRRGEGREATGPGGDPVARTASRTKLRPLRPRLLDRRERVEVALHALDELVVVARHDAELGLPARSIPATTRIGADDARDPRPLRGDDHEDAEGEQRNPRPAHVTDSTSPVEEERPASHRHAIAPRSPRDGR